MARFPSSNIMTYESGALSNDAWSSIGYLNLPKDCSLLNMRGYSSTTRKGVPLVYRVKFDLFSQTFAGQGPGFPESGDYVDTEVEGLAASDFHTTMSILTCQNNWVTRNAAVKWHAAREKMYRDAGVKKGTRGAYAHVIRYGFDAHNQTWMSPLDGQGAAFTGGTWDLSDFAYSEDSSFKLVLVGNGDDEETDAFTGNSLQIAHSYLLSRISQQADTNLETEEGPAQFSVLKKLLSPSSNVDLTVEDNVTADARDEQDNPPYEVLDLSDSGDVSHDVTEDIEAGRAIASVGSGIGSVICDIPFGLAQIKARHFGATDQAITNPVTVKATVLDIYEMQG